jgi:hypothetical protein
MSKKNSRRLRAAPMSQLRSFEKKKAKTAQFKFDTPTPISIQQQQQGRGYQQIRIPETIEGDNRLL